MKKKGSALVFSVLMLAFFLAISLNIFFQARKKAERAGVKVQGEMTTNNIDIASSIGYQELKLAEEFVRLGFPYDPTHPNSTDDYSLPSYNADGYLYIDPANGEFNSGERYAGIQINNFIDYFSSNWNSGGGSNQKLIIGEMISASGDKALSRMWQSSGVTSSITPLWELYADDNSDNSLSIGGYSYNSDESDAIPTSDGTYPGLTAIYEKFIRLPKNDTLGIPESVFRLEVTEEFDYTVNGSTAAVSNRNLSSFIIEALD